MSDLIRAAQAVVDAYDNLDSMVLGDLVTPIVTLRAALADAQQAGQTSEPVAWVLGGKLYFTGPDFKKHYPEALPLYTHPPRPAEQTSEPVPFCYLRQTSSDRNPPHGWAVHFTESADAIPLYTHPPRPAVRLTGGEIAQIELRVLAVGGSNFDFYRAIESAVLKRNGMEVE